MVQDGPDFIRSVESFMIRKFRKEIFKERGSTFEDASELVIGRHGANDGT